MDFTEIVLYVKTDGRYVELCKANHLPAKGNTIRLDTTYGRGTYRVTDVVEAYRDVDSLSRIGATLDGELFTVYPSVASVYLDPVQVD